MHLGPDEDLLIDKLKTLFCLFVNGYADIDGGERVRRAFERGGGCRQSCLGAATNPGLLKD